jgi:CDP-diacylglycerol--serine O-phosphatidyltransferase
MDDAMKGSPLPVEPKTHPTSPAAMLAVSNLVTYASLACGLLAVSAAVWYRNAPIAGLAMALSVVADTLDGRFARRFERTAVEREFGAQLDSLADAVCSGLVPVAVLAPIALTPAPIVARAAWGVAALFYVIAVVTRLGFYNVLSDDEVFIGLPAPVGALAVATLLLFPAGAVAAAVVLIMCAALMLAPFRIVRPKGWRLLAFVAWALAVVAAHTSRLLGN